MALLGLAATIAGAALLTTVGVDGVYEARGRMATSGHAIVFDALSVGPLPFDDVHLDVTVAAERPVFVGIAPADQVAAALDGVAVARIVRIDPGAVDLDAVDGTADPPPPADVADWVAADDGTRATITWTVAPGSWALAIMDAEGAAGIDVVGDVRIGVPVVGPLGVVLAVVGVALLAGGADLHRGRREAPAPGRALAG